jgi:hypothetical protein
MRKLLMAVLIIASAGCLKDNITGSSTATGVYTLRRLNDTSLPYTLPNTGGTKTEVIDATLTLYQGGTYAETRHLRLTTNGQTTTETREEAGSYTFFGITLTLTNGVTLVERRGRIEGNTMTIVEPGVTWTYRK